MSSDPVTVILDQAQVFKREGSRIFNKTVDSVTDFISKNKAEIIPQPPPPPGLLEKTSNWFSRNKWLIGIITAGTVGTCATASFIYLQSKRGHKKSRRAVKADNGARKQVVLIAGSPNESICRIVADDLNKRGFIVYITTSSTEEEELVASENSEDIRSLPMKAQEFGKFSQDFGEILNTPVNVLDTVHNLELVGVIVLPDLYYPTGPVETIRADTWSDLIYSKLLGPMFMLSSGLLDVVRQQKSRVILMTPNIMGSLNPAFHAPESLISNAHESLALCMHRELQPQNIPFIHLKLGSFDVRPGRKSANQQKQIQNGIRADVLGWNDSQKTLYSQAYQASSHLQTARVTGSSLKVLNHAVVDSLMDKNPQRVVYVGKGSYAYEWLSGFVSEGIMTWLLQPSSRAREEL